MQHDTFLMLQAITMRLASIDLKCDRILALLNAVTSQETKLMAAIDDLEAEVSKVGTVQDSAIALINGISQQLKDAGSNDPRINAVIQSLDAKSQALAAAVSANTPAATGGGGGATPTDAGGGTTPTAPPANP